ncbi:hypothetical protein L1987_12991 [Smallanthus sonchifolius]|uniref:Uncharacterized protein n=1 Tax=Smallanthus sonchifolius TaxID=185202 RepID=A0ACB9JHK4_9ASTR|nr:hypothetical protein L1987_12991 [Smallanthus sonchifolius]
MGIQEGFKRQGRFKFKVQRRAWERAEQIMEISTLIFFTNIPPNASEKDLRRRFQEWGIVIDVFIATKCIENLSPICVKERFTGVEAKYIGGKWVILEFPSLLRFRNNLDMNVFLNEVDSQFVLDERITRSLSVERRSEVHGGGMIKVKEKVKRMKIGVGEEA